MFKRYQIPLSSGQSHEIELHKDSHFLSWQDEDLAIQAEGFGLDKRLVTAPYSAQHRSQGQAVG